MKLFQPPVKPLPAGLDLSGKTVIVTGASAGIGQEISRQFLIHKASTVILAVRNMAKGEATRQLLLSDPSVRASNPRVTVKVMRLDAEDYKSVSDFTRAFLSEHARLHVLMLNAGIGHIKRQVCASGHEKNVQVNFLSNVLLTLQLLPLLEQTAATTGSPSRITWTGSRMHGSTSLATKAPLGKEEGVLEHFDKEENFFPFTRYGDSKLLCILFLYELAKHVDGKKVIHNAFCPGMIDTAMSDVLPVYLRLPVNIFKAVRARGVEKAGWIALHAAVIAGPESHGRFFGDTELLEPIAYIKSSEGQRAQKMLWDETVDEMSKLVELPEWMGRVGWEA